MSVILVNQNLTHYFTDLTTFCDCCLLKMLCLFRLDELIETFLEDSDPESTLDVGADMRKIKYCFTYLKVFLLNIGRNTAGTVCKLKTFTIEKNQKRCRIVERDGKW